MSKVMKIGEGFTLIQNLILGAVILVIALSAFIIFDPIAQVQKANDTKSKNDLSLIQKVLDKYYKDFGKYPQNPGNCPSADYRIVGLDANNQIVDWGASFSPYTSLLPKDPNPTKKYVYFVSCDGQKYYLYASLDRGGKDKDSCNMGNACSSISLNNIDKTACGGICNYGVSSDNVTP